MNAVVAYKRAFNEDTLETLDVDKQENQDKSLYCALMQQNVIRAVREQTLNHHYVNQAISV